MCCFRSFGFPQYKFMHLAHDFVNLAKQTVGFGFTLHSFGGIHFHKNLCAGNTLMATLDFGLIQSALGITHDNVFFPQQAADFVFVDWFDIHC